MSYEAPQLPPYEDKGVTMPPEQLYQDSRVERFDHTDGVAPEALGTAREAVVNLRSGLRTLTSGIEDHRLGNPYPRPGYGDLLEHVQTSGNEVVDQDTEYCIASALASIERGEESGEARLTRTAAAARAFSTLAESVTAALDLDPTSIDTSVPDHRKVADGPGGGGDQEHDVYAIATLDAVQLMKEVVNGSASEDPRPGHRRIVERQHDRSTLVGIATDQYTDTSRKPNRQVFVTLSEVPLPKLGVSIIVRESTPEYPTEKNSRRVETYVVSTVKADRRRGRSMDVMSGRRPEGTRASIKERAY